MPFQIKVIRMALGNAVRHGLLTVNPAEKVDALKARGEARRRNFTAAEIRRVLDATDENPEWRGLVLFGLYTGQRGRVHAPPHWLQAVPPP